jgi:Lar family restriction alleviation protein
MNKGLKPCPFCGNKKSTFQENIFFYDHGEWAVVCLECSADGPFRKTKEQAAATWNRRAGEAK